MHMYSCMYVRMYMYICVYVCMCIAYTLYYTPIHVARVGRYAWDCAGVLAPKPLHRGLVGGVSVTVPTMPAQPLRRVYRPWLGTLEFHRVALQPDRIGCVHSRGCDGSGLSLKWLHLVVGSAEFPVLGNT